MLRSINDICVTFLGYTHGIRFITLRVERVKQEGALACLGDAKIPCIHHYRLQHWTVSVNEELVPAARAQCADF